MGAFKPEAEKPDTRRQVSLLPLLLGLVAGLVLFRIIGLAGSYEAPKLQPKEEEKLQKRLKEIDDSEQYALIAIVNGWYPCLHSGHVRCYLKIGEVWKYGVTSKGKFGRYSTVFLAQNKVSYIIQFRGSYSECLKQEQIKLFYYKYLPENLARHPNERLPRPPYNSVMR